MKRRYIGWIFYLCIFQWIPQWFLQDTGRLAALKDEREMTEVSLEKAIILRHADSIL